MRTYHLLHPFVSLLAVASRTLAHPQFGDANFNSSSLLLPRQTANPNLVGYLGAFFLGNEPSVFFYLSNGNNPTSFRALNGGRPRIVPTLGSRGVRDPTIVQGGGSEAGRKWYIIGTDLNIATTNWDNASRRGSLSIFVWESTDLVNWSQERIVRVEDSTAGMVWAPEAIWDTQRSQYMVFWSSRFFSASDTGHTGTPTPHQIRYAYTSDFRTFSAPATYVNKAPTAIIDLNILHLGGTSYARFLKNEDSKAVFTEVTTQGLFGTWTSASNTPISGGIIANNVEGPWAYWDNQVSGKAYLLLDFYGGNGYYPMESTDVRAGRWARVSSASGFPANLRHGSVIGVNRARYDALNRL